MAFFALSYEYGPDYMDVQAAHMPAHLAYWNAAAARGEVVFAGAAMENAVPFGFLVMQANDPAEVEAFAKADPYVTGGVCKGWKVRPWFGIIGPGGFGAA